MTLVRTRILLYSFSPAAPTYPSQHRWISSTTRLSGSWMNKIKGVFTGQKPTSSDDPSESITAESFTLPQFADGLKNAKRLGTFKQYMVGRSSEATFVDAFEKQEAILRYLGGLDPTGEEDHKHLFLGSADGPEDTCLEGLSYTPFKLKGLHNLQSSQKQEAAKHCKCTAADVENALAKFTWAKEAQKKMEKLKEEGKPMPTSMAEVQKLMGSTPMDVAQSNLAKSGQISRNAMCPCGSKKRYKRCCGKD